MPAATYARVAAPLAPREQITAVTASYSQVQVVPTWDTVATGVNGRQVLPMASAGSRRPLRLPEGKSLKLAGVVVLIGIAVAGGSYATRQNLLPGGTVYDNHQMSGARTAGYDSGRSEGYDEGQASGYDSGYSAGKTAGYDTGYETGYDSGNDAGYTAARDDSASDASAQRDEGYADGYQAGVSCASVYTTDSYLNCTGN